MGDNRTGKNPCSWELMLSLPLQALGHTAGPAIPQAYAGYINTFLESLIIHTIYLPHLGWEAGEIKRAKNQHSE